MALRIFLSSTLRRHIPGYDPLGGIALETLGPSTVRDVLKALGIPLDEVKVIMVEGIHRSVDHVLKGEERVAVFPSVGGG